MDGNFGKTTTKSQHNRGKQKKNHFLTNTKKISQISCFLLYSCYDMTAYFLHILSMKKEAQINVYYYQNFSVENNHFMNLFVRPSNRVFTRSKIFTIGILFSIYVSEQASLDLLLYSSFLAQKQK